MAQDQQPHLTDGDAYRRLAAAARAEGDRMLEGCLYGAAAAVDEIALHGRLLRDDEQVCGTCQDVVYTLSSDGLCDGCVEYREQHQDVR